MFKKLRDKFQFSSGKDYQEMTYHKIKKFKKNDLLDQEDIVRVVYNILVLLLFRYHLE